MLSVIELDWLLILSLIFGGCCSNAYYLELSTQALPSCGTILTISQFFFTSFFSLSSQLYLKDSSLEEVKGDKHINGDAAAQTNGIPKEDAIQKENRKPGMRISQVRKRNQKSRYLSNSDSDPTKSKSKTLDANLDSNREASLSTFQLLTLLLFSPLDVANLRWKKPSVPLSRWSVQVILYLATSLLNNTAFAYQIPMPVHIIFRSGGLVINMALGWAIGRKYTPLQVFSVFLVTFGVCLATLSTSPPSSASSSSSTSSSDSSTIPLPPYTFGVLLLTLALLLSGLMGLYQERTYAQYGSNHWREGLFYSHALSLPLFIFRRNALISEWNEALKSRKVWIGWGKKLIIPDAPFTKTSLNKQLGENGFDLKSLAFRMISTIPLLNRFNPQKEETVEFDLSSKNPYGLIIPLILPLLLLNVLTQLLCINGVNRLTARVTSLTVTLILVVRKALSLAISVVLVGGGKGNPQLWLGSSAVLAGTIGYSVGGSKKTEKKKGGDEKLEKVENKKGQELQTEEQQEETEGQDQDPWSQAGRTIPNQQDKPR